MSEHEPTQRGRRGPYAKTERTRQVILDAALEVFAAAGYRSGSLRDVANRVGISEAGLLHHFPSKSELLAQVLERRDEYTLANFDFNATEPESVVRAFVDLARYNATTPGVVELYCRLSAEATSPDHPAHEYFVRRYENARESVMAAFCEFESRGKLRHGTSPALATRTVLAIFDGLQIQWLLDRSLLDMSEDIEAYLRAILKLDH